MKNKLILCMAALLAVLPLTSSALVVTRSYSNNTTDDDNSSLEEAISGQSVIGARSITVDTVGSTSAAQGYRFYGAASAGDGGDITQNINVSAIWTVTAEDWEEYTIDFSSALQAWMNIEDGGLFQESGDIVKFSSFESTVTVNNSVNYNFLLLDLAGATREAKGSGSFGDTGSKGLPTYTGNNTFELNYTATLTATSKAGSAGNDTYVAGLWGRDGLLGSIGSSDGTFDNYNPAGDADDDGLFVEAIVTLQAVPEPASVLMLVFGGGLIALKRRFFAQV